jgi:hypothetical protein
MTRRTAFIATLLLGQVLVLPAQSVDFDPAPLHFGTDSMAIALVRDGKVEDIGQLWDEFGLDPAAPSERLRRIYRTTNAVFGPHLDTTFVVRRTLQPWSRRTRAQLFSDSVVVREGRVSGWVVTGSRPPVTLNRSLAPGVIDASFFDAAMRAAPLAMGFRLAMSGYAADQDSVLALVATVTGEDVIAQRDGQQVPVWVVTMDFAGLPSTMWIDKKNRGLIRQTITLSPRIQMLMQR